MHPGSDLDDDTRRFATWRERERRSYLILPHHHERIRKVHTGGVHLNHDIASRRHRIGYGFHRERFRLAKSTTNDSTHGGDYEVREST